MLNEIYLLISRKAFVVMTVSRLLLYEVFKSGRFQGPLELLFTDFQLDSSQVIDWTIPAASVENVYVSIPIRNIFTKQMLMCLLLIFPTVYLCYVGKTENNARTASVQFIYCDNVS